MLRSASLGWPRYIYKYIFMYICIYIYILRKREREREREREIKRERARGTIAFIFRIFPCRCGAASQNCWEYSSSRLNWA